MPRSKREVVWRLRELMAERGLYMTTALLPLLKEKGIALSREQIYRIATTVPQRLSLDLLGALCEILECSPNDLIQFRRARERRRAVGETQNDGISLRDIKLPERNVIRPNFTDEDE